ncbi:MAG TPA: hypothetical protein VGF64_12940, partial [Acidimicrobiales bacterium]
YQGEAGRPLTPPAPAMLVGCGPGTALAQGAPATGALVRRAGLLEGRSGVPAPYSWPSRGTRSSEA